ncbi:hypothetical protein KSS87_016467 [Heliosperma pusillum]|nr:hypothetical protein KSS87_016467 [Heliosperma pusillum]
MLSVGYYSASFPEGEAIVKRIVFKSVAATPGLGAGLIRLHFHDCFVRGCDASVLLDSVPGKEAERVSPANIGLRGFEIVEPAKKAVEAICPGIMSCADILSLAARDSAALLGGIDYNVPCGRLDGLVSVKAEPLQILPAPSSTLDVLEGKFVSQGLTINDAVILSGAHSLGVAHCTSFQNRLYSFNASHPQDPSMDPHLADVLKKICPQSVTTPPLLTAYLDFQTPNQLDNQYYINVQTHRGLFKSDQALLDSQMTNKLVNNFATDSRVWKEQFAAAMVKLGSIVSSHPGDIRKVCSAINVGVTK